MAKVAVHALRDRTAEVGPFVPKIVVTIIVSGQLDLASTFEIAPLDEESKVRSFWTHPINSLIGYAILAFGIPPYLYWRRRAALEAPAL